MKLDLTIPHEDSHPAISWHDPGGTTGWAMYTHGEFWGGQIGPEEHHLALYDHMGKFLMDNEADTDEIIVGMEDFDFRQNTQNDEDSRKGLELISREYIGIAKLFCLEHDATYQHQLPMERMFISDKKLARMGLFDAHGAATNPEFIHMWDALRHLLVYMIVRKRIRDGLVDKMRRPRVT